MAKILSCQEVCKVLLVPNAVHTGILEGMEDDRILIDNSGMFSGERQPLVTLEPMLLANERQHCS